MLSEISIFTHNSFRSCLKKTRALVGRPKETAVSRLIEKIMEEKT